MDEEAGGLEGVKLQVKVEVEVKNCNNGEEGRSLPEVLFTFTCLSGIKVEGSSERSSVIRYCRIAYANVGIKANRSSLSQPSKPCKPTKLCTL